MTMQVALLKHTWKAPTEYTYSYVLVTDKYSVDDIRKAKRTGRKIACFGSQPDSYVPWLLLAEHGLNPDVICDINWTGSSSINGVPVRPYWELLQNKDAYYFIITLSKNPAIIEITKILLHAGIDEFGIVLHNYSKDFSCSNTCELQRHFYETLSEIFSQERYLNNYAALENLRRSSLEGAGYWDVLYVWLYEFNKRKKRKLSYLEIGPGFGVLSFCLKKLLNMEITWIVIPEPELAVWKETETDHFTSLQEKYAIQTQAGFIETDAFTGKYDSIVLAQVMEHFIYNPVATFQKIAAMLHDNGYIYVSVPLEIRRHNVRSWREMPFPEALTPDERSRRNAINAYGHFHEYSYEEAEEIFTDSGLEIVGYKYTLPIHHFMLRKMYGKALAREIA